jgi:hypothetical protein
MVGTVSLILSLALVFKVTILCNILSACHSKHYHVGTSRTAQSSIPLPYLVLSNASKSPTSLMHRLVRRYIILTFIILSSFVEAEDLSLSFGHALS